mmetsp:Transcript_29113/g.52044  ORF Transcript_29113/g.52044 Transcript_29113/m.52044 type:complete len:367 (-) Transcript_29113:147-1247(-)
MSTGKTQNSSSVIDVAESRGGGVGGWWRRVRQQKLVGWAPRPSLASVLGYYASVSCLLLALGGLQYAYNGKVVSLAVRYDGTVPGQNCSEQYEYMRQHGDRGVPVNVTITVPRRMEAPIYVFYFLGRFIPGHKRFQRSRDDEQIAGNRNQMQRPLAACQPQAFVGSEGNGRNEQLPNDGAITPCGLIGWSQFNDTFRMPGFPIEDTDIAWKTDRDFLFGDVESVNYNRNTTLRGGATTTKLLSESERLIVWFRVSAFPDPTYRWGTIQQDLEPGTYELQIENRYNTYGFCGKKELILSTNTWNGGPKQLLSVLYLLVGSLFSWTFILFMIAFFGFRRRQLGDFADLSWNKADMRAMREAHGDAGSP